MPHSASRLFLLCPRGTFLPARDSMAQTNTTCLYNELHTCLTFASCYGHGIYRSSSMDQQHPQLETAAPSASAPSTLRRALCWAVRKFLPSTGLWVLIVKDKNGFRLELCRDAITGALSPLRAARGRDSLLERASPWGGQRGGPPPEHSPLLGRRQEAHLGLRQPEVRAAQAHSFI